ncbi:site-specific integrase [Clostridium beijerinckii]|uniref:Site-specific integrase n=1 Tax=Clostridium beijerinckii TaxID=1520 RepID=A0AB74VGV1_CLOBE|nr:site-specific integrase [Clostridium beijerinckii]NRZ24825.1 integrase [Clostridium beijerinckii]NYB98961.1 integrase [Clostridium beijerinckii]OOM24975.1 transposase from transposon [Clostridium beijerinckii]QUN35631.1 site-specific integrase [Clostridium beijerinckii]SQB22009.1 phage integrase [Clostridium beijerinckii]
MAKTNYLKRTINGKEYYYFRLRHNNLNKPKDVYATTVKELDQKIRKIRNELENNIINNKEVFETFFANWLFDVKFLTLKPSTKERYEIIYRNYIKNSPLSKIKIKDITLTDIQEYYNALIKRGSTVSCILALNKLIAPCIRYAYNNSILIRDFTGAIVLPKESEETKLNKANKVQPFSLDEHRRFITTIKGHELEMLFLTALNTGMRQGELFALTWNDINFQGCYVSVNKTAKNVAEVSREGREPSKVIIQTPKTVKSNRRVSIPNALSEQLKQYKLKQSEYKLKLANLYENNNLVFCTIDGKYLDSSNVRKRFKKIIDTINSNKSDDSKIIKTRTFHDLRHTYATRLFELGESPKTVQELLGHSDISITLDTYTHVLENIKVMATSKLNDLYISMKAK